MPGATLLKTSEFAKAMVENMNGGDSLPLCPFSLF